MTQIDNLASEIQRALDLYSLQVRNDTEEIAQNISEQGVEKLKATSPRRAGGGDYAGSWAVERQGKVFVIHNKDHYSLTHLLERGHATRDGGRTKAQPHIKKVETELIADFEAEIRRSLG